MNLDPKHGSAYGGKKVYFILFILVLYGTYKHFY